MVIRFTRTVRSGRGAESDGSGFIGNIEDSGIRQNANGDPIYSYVGLYSAVDTTTGGGISYSLSGETQYFSLDSNTGRFYFITGLNYETDADKVLSAVITAHSTTGTDENGPTGAISTLFLYTLSNRNDEASEWAQNPDGALIDEAHGGGFRFGAFRGAAVATFSVNDPDGAGAEYLVTNVRGDGAGTNVLTIGGDGILRMNTDIDYESVSRLFPLYVTGDDVLVTAVINARGTAGGRPVNYPGTAPDGTTIISQLFVITIRDVEGDTLAFTRTPFRSYRGLENDNTTYSPSLGTFVAVDSAEPTTNVVTVMVTDPDTSAVTTMTETVTVPNVITYSLSGPAESAFSIDAMTGDLRLISNFDTEGAPNADGIYSVNVVAHSSSGAVSVAAPVVITFTNRNDEPTTWVNTPQGLEIKEQNNDGTGARQATRGTILATFGADDVDGDQIFYYLSNPNPVRGAEDQFSRRGAGQPSLFVMTIDINTGVLRIRNTIDFEAAAAVVPNLVSDAGTPNDATDDVLLLTAVVNAIGNSGAGGFATNPNADGSAVGYSVGGGGGVVSTLFVLTIANVDNENTVQFYRPVLGYTVNETDDFYRLSIGRFRATDADNPTGDVSYEITGDEAYYSFNHDTGDLYFLSELDYEMSPRDDGRFTLLITATAEDMSTATSNFVIQLRNRNDELPVATISPDATVSINQGENDNIVATYQVQDPDGDVTYAIASIGRGNRGYLNFYYNQDFTNDQVVIRARDDAEFGTYSFLIGGRDVNGGPWAFQTLVVNIGSNNDDPTTLPMGNNPRGANLSETNAIGTAVATFNPADADGDTAGAFSYWLSGIDNIFFSIGEDNDGSGNGVLTVTSVFDFENTEHSAFYTVTVHVLGTAGGRAVAGTSAAIPATIDFVLTIDNNTSVEFVGTPPTGFSMNETNMRAPQPLVTFVAVDPDNTASSVSYSLAGDAAYFTINSDSGILEFRSTYDYEQSPRNNGIFTVAITAHSTVSDVTATVDYAITIGNINDNPTIWFGDPSMGASINENNAVGSSLAFFTPTDNDGANISYWLSAGGDSRYFSLVADTSTGNFRINLVTASSFDAEDSTHDNTYTAVINVRGIEGGTATAGTSAAVVLTHAFVVTIGDINDNVVRFRASPTRGLNIDETDAARNTAVGNFGATDDDVNGGVSYSFVSGGDINYFSIDASGNLFFVSNLDHEISPRGDGVFMITVRAHSTTLGDSSTVSASFALTINNLNDERSTWASNGNPATGSIIEDSLIDRAVATFTAADVDGAGFSYWVTNKVGSGLNDVNYFSIFTDSQGRGILRVRSSFDFENPFDGRTDNLYTVIINVRGTGGGSGVREGTTALTQEFVLSINDGVDPATFTNIPAGGLFNHAEDDATTDPTEAIFTFAANNPNTAIGRGITYSIDTDFGNADADEYFSINANTGELYFLRAFDADARYSNGQRILPYSLVVNINASSFGSAREASALVIFSIINSNDEATTWGTVTTGASLDENNAVNDLVANFNATDADGVGFSYWLTGDDASNFAIDNTGALRASQSLDYETQKLYTMQVNALGTAGDDVGKAGVGAIALTQLFILTVGNLNDNPTLAAGPGQLNFDTAAVVPENLAPINTPTQGFVGIRGFTDADHTNDDNFSIWLTGDAEYFSILPSASTAGVSISIFITSTFDYEHRSSHQYTLVINGLGLEGGTPTTGAVTTIFVLTISDSGVDDPDLGDRSFVLTRDVADSNLDLSQTDADHVNLANLGGSLEFASFIGSDYVINDVASLELSFDNQGTHHWWFVVADSATDSGYIFFDADGDTDTDNDVVLLFNGDNSVLDSGETDFSDDFTAPTNLDESGALTFDQFLALLNIQAGDITFV